MEHALALVAAPEAGKTRAYYEIWIDGEKAAAAESAPEEVEPLYCSAYLPRKFKISFAAPGDNCVDVYTNDIGIVPRARRRTGWKASRSWWAAGSV